MTILKLISLFSLGAATSVFIDLIKNVYLYKKKNYPTKEALGVIASLVVFGVIGYTTTKGKEENEEEIVSYSGIVVNPNEARATCYCEPVVLPRCYAKGVIGALSKEQAMEFCPEKYKRLLKVFSELKQETEKEKYELQGLNLPSQAGKPA